MGWLRQDTKNVKCKANTHDCKLFDFNSRPYEH